MTINRNDLFCGAIFIAIGAVFGADAIFELPLGSAFRMGPGYFPLVLAGLLVLLGAGIIVSGVGVATPARSAPRRPPTTGEAGMRATLAPYADEWRGVVAILVSPIVFGVTVQPLGLIPSLTAAGLIASFASKQVTLRFAVLMTAILTLFCYLVFSVGLRLPIRPFGPLFDPLLRLVGA